METWGTISNQMFDWKLKVVEYNSMKNEERWISRWRLKRLTESLKFSIKHLRDGAPNFHSQYYEQNTPIDFIFFDTFNTQMMDSTVSTNLDTWRESKPHTHMTYPINLITTTNTG